MRTVSIHCSVCVIWLNPGSANEKDVQYGSLQAEACEAVKAG